MYYYVENLTFLNLIKHIFFLPLAVTGAYNIGIFHWRPTNVSIKLAKEWKDLLLTDETIWDQNGFNELVHKVLGPSVEGEDRLVYAFDGNLKLGILPATIFCSGHTYFVQVMTSHGALQLTVALF